MPSMVTSLAFVVCQLSVVDCPFWIALGLADSEAVGAGGGGGGGGGGGATFFLQAPNIMMAPRMNTRAVHFIFGCFTVLLPESSARGTCGWWNRAAGQHL